MTKDEGIKTAVLVRRCSVRRLANDALITPYESVTSRLCNSHGGGKKTLCYRRFASHVNVTY